MKRKVLSGSAKFTADRFRKIEESTSKNFRTPMRLMSFVTKMVAKEIYGQNIIRFKTAGISMSMLADHLLELSADCLGLYDPNKKTKDGKRKVSFLSFANIFFRNRARNFMKNPDFRQRRSDEEGNLKHSLVTRIPGPEDEIIIKERNELLAQAIGDLSRENRTILYEYFFEGRNQREIGDELGLSQSTVYRRIRDALKELKEGSHGKTLRELLRELE